MNAKLLPTLFLEPIPRQTVPLSADSAMCSAESSDSTRVSLLATQGSCISSLDSSHGASLLITFVWLIFPLHYCNPKDTCCFRKGVCIILLSTQHTHHYHYFYLCNGERVGLEVTASYRHWHTDTEISSPQQHTLVQFQS